MKGGQQKFQENTFVKKVMSKKFIKINSEEKVSNISERLLDFLESHDMKQRDVAELCRPYCQEYGIRIESNDINQYIRGKANPNPDRLAILSKALNVSEVWLLGYDVAYDLPKNISLMTTQHVPLVGSIACGTPIFAEQEYDTYIKTNSDIDCDFCLKAKGTSMIGDHIFPGDIVFIKKQQMVENGEIAAIIIDDEATLKRVYYYPEKNIIVFKASNPKFSDIIYTDKDLETIYILGKAVAFTSKIQKIK